MATRKKIESLTAEQELALIEWRQRWFEYGTCVDPADRPRAQTAITAMYAVIDEPAPMFIWFDSPATGLIGIDMFRRVGAADEPLRDSLRDSLWDSLRDSLWDSLGDSLGGSLWDSLWDSLRGSLRGSLRDSLGGSLRDSLGGSLRDSLRGSLRDSLRGSLRDSLGGSLRDSLGGSLWGSLGDSLRDSLGGSSHPLTRALGQEWWGQHEAYWISLYAFARDVLGVKYDPEKSQHLDLWAEVAQSCGWWWPYKGLVVCTERPAEVHMESWPGGPWQRERLHRQDGPALLYRDGWPVYAWHGLRTTEQVVCGQFDAAAITAEQNIEVRRAMLERFGTERFIRESGAVKVNVDKYGTLWRSELPDDEPILMVEVVNSTPEADGSSHVYWIRVPPTITTAHEGIAWSFEQTTDTYAPSVES